MKPTKKFIFILMILFVPSIIIFFQNCSSTSFTSITRQLHSSGTNSSSSSANVPSANIIIDPNFLLNALKIPNLTDEENTYKKWGWTWSASNDYRSAVVPADINYEPICYNSNCPFVASISDVHYDPEADDLWNSIVMYERTNNVVYLNRAKAWATYYTTSYMMANCSINGQTVAYCINDANEVGFGGDHTFGSGLFKWYEYTCKQGACDNNAMVTAEQIGEWINFLWSANSNFGCYQSSGCKGYGLRAGGRQLLILVLLAEATKKQKWIDLRDKILNIMIDNTQWDARGMYVMSAEQAGYGNYTDLYNAGWRAQSTFQVGVFMEALFQAYRVTGRADIKSRMAAMANFVKQYGLDPTYDYSGATFGVLNGTPLHNYNHSQSTTRDCSIYWDPVYTTSLVNTLVIGYKLTGDGSYLSLAQHYFDRGTKGQYGQSCEPNAANNVNKVHHFVDTRFDSSTSYFYWAYNKGELQYTYLLFENGGNPSVIP